jgi:hypothetical protein
MFQNEEEVNTWAAIAVLRLASLLPLQGRPHRLFFEPSTFLAEGTTSNLPHDSELTQCPRNPLLDSGPMYHPQDGAQ